MSVETGTPLSRGSARQGTVSQEKEAVSSKSLSICPFPSTLPRVILLSPGLPVPLSQVWAMGAYTKSITGWTPPNPSLQITQQHSWGLCPGRHLGQGQGHTMIRPSRTIVASRLWLHPVATEDTAVNTSSAWQHTTRSRRRAQWPADTALWGTRHPAATIWSPGRRLLRKVCPRQVSGEGATKGERARPFG